MDEDLHQLYVSGNNPYTLIEQSYCETSSLICRMPQSMATMKTDKLLAFLPHSNLCALCGFWSGYKNFTMQCSISVIHEKFVLKTA